MGNNYIRIYLSIYLLGNMYSNHLFGEIIYGNNRITKDTTTTTVTSTSTNPNQESLVKIFTPPHAYSVIQGSERSSESSKDTDASASRSLEDSKNTPLSIPTLSIPSLSLSNVLHTRTRSTKNNDQRDLVASTTALLTDAPIITDIAVDRYEYNPCFALNATRADDTCVMDARQIDDWKTFPLNGYEPCIRSTGLNGAYAHILINGSNFGSKTNDIRINVISLVNNKSIQCDLINPYIPLATGGIESLRCTPSVNLPVGRLNINITVDERSVTSSMFNITPIAVCPCGTYPTDNETCVICPLGGSCRGGFDQPRAILGYWKTYPMEWLNDRFIDTKLYNIPPFVSCADPKLCLGDQTCYSGSTGFMCTQCLPNYQRDILHGGCSECNAVEGTSAIVSIIMIPLSILILWYLFRLWNFYRPRLSIHGIRDIRIINRFTSPPRSSTTNIGRIDIDDRTSRLDYPSFSSLLRHGLIFSQVLGILSLYFEPINSRTNIHHSDSKVLPNFFSSFKIFTDLGCNSHSLQCYFGTSYQSKLTLFIMLPFIVSYFVYLSVASIYYTFTRSTLYRKTFPNIRKPKGTVVRERANTASQICVYIIMLPSILMYGIAQSCALVNDGGYLLRDPSVSCYDPQFKSIQRVALVICYICIFSLLLSTILLVRAGVWHSTIIRKVVAYNITINREYGDSRGYRLSGRVALYYQNLIRQIEQTTRTVPSFSAPRASFSDRWNASIIDAHPFFLDSIRRESGFLYAWEVLAFFRNIVFGCLTVGLFGFDFPLTRIIVTIFLMIIALAVHVYVQPYRSKLQNVLETLSLFGQLSISLAVMARIAFTSSSNSIGKSISGTTNPSVVEPVPSWSREQFLFDILAILFCVPFLGLWLVFIIDEVLFRRKWTGLLVKFLDTYYSSKNDATLPNRNIINVRNITNVNNPFALRTRLLISGGDASSTSTTSSNNNTPSNGTVPDISPGTSHITNNYFRDTRRIVHRSRPPPPYFQRRQQLSSPRPSAPSFHDIIHPQPSAPFLDDVTANNLRLPISTHSTSVPTTGNTSSSNNSTMDSSDHTSYTTTNIVFEDEEDITDPVTHPSSSSNHRTLNTYRDTTHHHHSNNEDEDDEQCTNPTIIIERKNHSRVRTLFPPKRNTSSGGGTNLDGQG